MRSLHMYLTETPARHGDTLLKHRDRDAKQSSPGLAPDYRYASTVTVDKTTQKHPGDTYSFM
jgi:hypothetical protein